jgi:hypothetical protein
MLFHKTLQRRAKPSEIGCAVEFDKRLADVVPLPRPAHEIIVRQQKTIRHLDGHTRHPSRPIGH